MRNNYFQGMILQKHFFFAKQHEFDTSFNFQHVSLTKQISNIVGIHLCESESNFNARIYFNSVDFCRHYKFLSMLE